MAFAIASVSSCDLLGAPVALAQLALDRRHLLAQDHFALAFVQGGPGLTADLLRQAQDLDPFGQQAGDLVEPRGEIDGFQKLLLLVSADIEIGRDEVRQSAGRGGGLRRFPTSSCGTCGRSCSASSACCRR